MALLRTWKNDTGTELVVRRVDDPALALRKGEIDLAFFRAKPGPPAFEHALLGHENRMLAVADDNPLNRTDTVSLDDLVSHRIALCSNAGTADLKLWPRHNRPDRTVIVANVDEWLTTIATGEAIGLTSEATEYSHPHPGVTYLPLPNTSPVPVYLTWPRRNQHPMTDRFVAHARRTLRQQGSRIPDAPAGHDMLESSEAGGRDRPRPLMRKE